MKKMITLALMSIALLTGNSASAQEKVEAHVQADLVSRYIWRGQDLAGISLQPSLGIEWRGLFFEGSGSIGFDRSDIEDLDLTIGYSRWGVNIGVTDYWATGKDPENRYFFYKDKETPHQLEANLGYSCKWFSLQGYCMFWGDDYKADGKRAYSTYVELSVPFRLGGLDWDLRAGITPMESAGTVNTYTDQGKYAPYTVVESDYFYGEGFTCNVAALRATKELHYKNVRIPVFAEINTNPYLQKAYVIGGISISPF